MDNEFTNALRQEAAELAAATKVIPITSSPDHITGAITGRILSKLLGTMADCTDYLAEVIRNESHTAGRAAISERNRTIRDAAANAFRTGNWDKFNAVIDASGPKGADGK